MEDRSQYLWLAQLSQSVVGSILLYLEDGKWDELKNTLSAIVLPLESACLGRDVPRSDRTAFASYEHLSTLSEAWDQAQSQQVAERLSALLKADDSPDTQRKAEELIEPFQRLSAQALWNFEQPDVGLPRGVYELCNAQ